MGVQHILLYGPLLLACACGSETPSDMVDADLPSMPAPDRDAPGPDAGAAPDAGERAGRDAGTNMDAPPDAQAVRPQTNVSFETATRIEADASNHLQDVRSADQVDYYVFHGEAGAYYELTTDTGRFQPDSVITLHDADHQVIARNDNGSRWPGDGIDARLVVRLPTGGDYYVTVEDPWTPQAFFDRDFALLFYHLRLSELLPGPGVAIMRDGALVEGTLREDEATGFAYLTALFDLGDEARSLRFAGRSGHALLGHVRSHESSGQVALANGDMQVLGPEAQAIAAIDRSAGQRNFDPPVDEGLYQLSAGGVAASDDGAFMAVDLLLVPDNPSEQNDDTNGKLAAAEALGLEGDFTRRGLVLLRVPPGDVDYFSLEVAEGELVAAECEGQSGGSGVRALSAELVDGDDITLASAQEGQNDSLTIEPIEVQPEQQVYLRVSNAAADGAIEPWVRCVVYAIP